jgi:hypothetical protein
VQSPPAIVRHLRVDERALRAATGAEFVEVARERQLLIRTLAPDANVADAVVRLDRPSATISKSAAISTRSRLRARHRSAV